MQCFAIVTVLAAGCLVACETAGKGPIAEAGYRAAAPVIAAIDRFHEDHGRYPAKLQELVPHYLRHVRQVAVFNSGLGDLQGFEYYPERDRYQLSFAYYTLEYTISPGYDSRTKKWETLVIR
jgi:hypothetical protein